MQEMMRILIGYDGSAASDDALDDLKRAGLPRRLEALVMTSTEIGVPLFTESEYADLNQARRENVENKMKHAQSLVERGTERLKNNFPLWQIHSETQGESPAWALINKAEEWKANLIVVGAHGHSRLSLYMGSVSQLVLMHAPCSVRVARAPQSGSAQENQRILVGVDGSPGAEKAWNVIKGREWPPETEVRIISALHSHFSLKMTHMVPPDVRAVHPVTGLERQAINQMVESLVDQLHGKQLQAAAYVREGDPKQVLVGEAETWKADCLFMGARGLSPLRCFLLGSVSMAVAARAHCSVEVVR